MLRRGVWRHITRGIVVMLLLAQWSVLSYACKLAGAGLSGESGSAGVASHAMVRGGAGAVEASLLIDCATMDGMSAYTQDELCAAHCAFGDQGDRSTPAAVPAVSLSVAYFLVPAAASTAPRRRSAAVAHALALASPPHAILHCVRRT